MGNSVSRTATIGALIEEGVILVHKDGNHGSNYPRTEEFGSEGVPFLTAKLLDDSGNIDFESAPRLGSAKADKFRFGFIEKGDVLLSHNATVGRVAVVPDFGERVLIGTSLTHFRLDTARLLPKYLAAYFSGREFQNQLAAVMSQTTRNQVPITSQRTLSVVIPPIVEQEWIADILGSFDDKIELNRQINQTLEQIAQTIFKSWFVDFEPVKAKIEAKAAGRDPERAAMCSISGLCPDGYKLEPELDQLHPDQYQQLAATAALFPDALVESELGLIPVGWEVIALYDTANYVNGSAFKSADFSEDGSGLPIVKIAELKQGITNQTKFTTKSFQDKYAIGSCDMLYSWSGSPETSLDVFKWFGGCGWLNQHIFKLNFSSRGQRYFAFYLLKHLKPLLVQTAMDKQTTGLGHVTIADMKRIKLAYPDQNLLRAFCGTVEPFYELDSQLSEQIITLTTIRDTLLPKLLSGELDSEIDVSLFMEEGRPI